MQWQRLFIRRTRTLHYVEHLLSIGSGPATPSFVLQREMAKRAEEFFATTNENRSTFQTHRQSPFIWTFLMRGSLVYPNNQKLYILQRFHDFRRFVNSHPDTEQLDVFDDFQCSEFCKKKLFQRITQLIAGGLLNLQTHQALPSSIL